MTLDIYPGGKSHFDLYEPGRNKVGIDVNADGKGASIRITPTGGRKFMLRVHLSKDVGAKAFAGKKLIKEVYPESLDMKPYSRISDSGVIHINPGQGKTIDLKLAYGK